MTVKDLWALKSAINLFLAGNSNIGLDLTQGLQQKLRLIWRLGNFLWFVDPKVVLLTKLEKIKSSKTMLTTSESFNLTRSHGAQKIKPNEQYINKLCGSLGKPLTWSNFDIFYY